MRACLYVGLFFGFSTVMACDARPFWQRFSEPNAANCMAASTSCDTGQVCNTVAEVCEPALEITSVAPDLVAGAGGDRIEIGGRNFGPDLTVHIGQSPSADASEFTLIDETRISVTVPRNPGTSWSVPVTVERPGQSVTRGGLLHYSAVAVSFSDMQIPSVSAVHEVFVADLNSDMRPDLLLVNNTNPDPRITTLLGKGDGTFNVGPTLLFTNRNLKQVVVQDLNRDNFPDLVVGSTNGVEILLNNKMGGWSVPQTVSTDTGSAMPDAQSITVADLNNDGLPDVAAANLTADSFTSLLNTGNGNFGAAARIASGTGPEIVLSGDFNGDKKTDLITMATTIPLEVRLGDGTSNFPVSSTPSATGCDARDGYTTDLNNDTHADIVMICRDNTIRVLLGNGNGTFASGDTPTVQLGSMVFPSTVVGDFDGDRRLDLMAGLQVGSMSSFRFYKGDGAGGFAAPTIAFVDPNKSVFGLAQGEFNGDGKPDLMVATSPGFFLFNTSH